MASCKRTAGYRLLAFGLLAAVVGCGGYGQVSPAAYEHAKSLYTLSNMRAVASLEGVEAGIEADLESQQITEREAAWLRDICQDCRAGKWREAQAAAREIMDDQVRR